MTETRPPLIPSTQSNSVPTLAPPMQLSQEDLANYYHCLGEIEAFYFYVCRVDEYSSKKVQWRFLNHKLNEISAETTRFIEHLQLSNSLCADQLRLDLENARRVLWLDDESDQARNDFLADEGMEVSSYNENNWHRDPHYWEDQTGFHLNELVLRLEDTDQKLVPESLISVFEYINDQRKNVLEEWVEVAKEKTNVHFAGRMRYWHRKGIVATDQLTYLLRNTPITFKLWKGIGEYALDRNDRCERVAQVYRRALRPKSFYNEAYPYPTDMNF